MKVTTKRLEAFSDGVLAIIITIMVLELKLPSLEEDSTSALLKHLKHLLPYFVIYGFSFMMIAIFWFNHHTLFHLLEKTDPALVWQNTAFLFFISLVPLATGIVGANPMIPLAPAVYGMIMLLCTVSFALMRHHSLTRWLLHTDRDENLTKSIQKVSVKARRKTIMGSLFYLASIPLAFVSVYISYACFIIPPVLFFIPDAIEDEKVAEKVDEKNN
jgi:uncharacterized membrane protein